MVKHIKVETKFTDVISTSKDPIGKRAAWIQIMAWRQTGHQTNTLTNDDPIYWRIYASQAIDLLSSLYHLQSRLYVFYKQLHSELTTVDRYGTDFPV